METGIFTDTYCICIPNLKRWVVVVQKDAGVRTLRRAVALCSVYGMSLYVLELTMSLLFAYLGFRGSFYLYVTASVILSVCCILLPSVFLAYGTCGFKKCFGNNSEGIGKGNTVLLVCFGLGACMSLNFLVSMLSLFLPFFHTQGISYSGSDIGSTVLLIFGFAVVPAVCEEFAFRGTLFSLLSDYGSGCGVFISAAFFGMVHSGPSAMLFAFLSGIVFGFVRKCSGKILPSVIVHFCNNAIAVITSSMGSIFGEGVSGMVFIIVSAASFVLMIFAFVFLRYRGVGIFTLSRTQGVMSFRDKSAAVLKSVFLWLFILLAVVVKLLF